MSFNKYFLFVKSFIHIEIYLKKIIHSGLIVVVNGLMMVSLLSEMAGLNVTPIIFYIFLFFRYSSYCAAMIITIILILK